MTRTEDHIARRRDRLREAFPAWTPRTLDAWLEDRAARFGDRPFVVTDQRTLTYDETLAWAQRLADGLAAIGVRPGDHVGLLLANELEFAPLKFAIARAGAVAIPFNYLYREDELAFVLRQSRCRVLVTMTGFAGLDQPAMLDAVAPGWRTLRTGEPGAPRAAAVAAHDGRAVDATAAPDVAEAFPDLRRVVLVPNAGPGPSGVLDVDGLAALGDAHPGAADGGGRRPDDVADILYTSGTTGSPKGVMVTHDAVLRTAYASALTRAFEDGRRILFSLPCYHMFGYVEGLLAATVVGGAIVPLTTFTPEGYFAGIARHRATDVLCVPTMTVALLEHPGRAEHDLSSLTAILSGAAPAPVWLWRQVEAELGVSEIVTGYGMTECGGAMTLTLPEDPLERAAETAGRPKLAGVAGVAGGAADGHGDAPLVRYATVDPESGAPLPGGDEGELVSSGPTAMLGYWDRPEETAATLRDGWIHSGDLGVVRPDGYLEITGRSKELYKSGGELVMPVEIEDLLSSHEGISQVFAVGVPDERWGDVGCACVVRAPGSTVDAAEILDRCRERLARFKVPKHVLFLEASELPTTPTGKVQKFRLARLAQERLALSR